MELLIYLVFGFLLVTGTVLALRGATEQYFKRNKNRCAILTILALVLVVYALPTYLTGFITGM